MRVKYARRGPLHGYGLTAHTKQVSQDALNVEEGSLYPALHRMEEAGLSKAKWVTTGNHRRARMYEITPRGLRELESEESRWRAISGAIGRAEGGVKPCPRFRVCFRSSTHRARES
jgi:PadR family transcriptional regulator, regulatory protein PadR